MGTVDARDDNVTYFASVFTLKSWQRSSLNSPVGAYRSVFDTAIHVEFVKLSYVCLDGFLTRRPTRVATSTRVATLLQNPVYDASYVLEHDSWFLASLRGALTGRPAFILQTTL